MDAAIQAEVEGLRAAFQINEAEYRRFLSGPVMRDLIRRGIRVESAAKKNASQPHRNGPNTGSVPGHGPAVRTGRLRASITHRPGVDALGPYVDVGSAVLYAPYVELGTSRMAARPFLRPALEAARL